MYRRGFCCLALLFLTLDPSCRSQENSPPTSLQAALGIQDSLNQLSLLNQEGQGGSLTAVNLRQPILIPAHTTVEIDVNLDFGFTDEHVKGKTKEEVVAEQFSNTDGLVAFDEFAHYRISFPMSSHTLSPFTVCCFTIWEFIRFSGDLVTAEKSSLPRPPEIACWNTDKAEVASGRETPLPEAPSIA